MPDPEGNITAGTDTVEAPGNTPVLSQPMPPDIITGTLPASVPPAAPAVGGPVAPNLPQPARPTQQPSFFRRVLLSLGQGLIEGTKAGLQAPLTPQGPAIAAQTAINAPEVARERLTAAQLDKVKIEMSTINMAMLRYALTHVDDERAQQYFKFGQKYANDLVEKGNAIPKSVGDEQTMAKQLVQLKADNPGEDYQMYPNPGGAYGSDKAWEILNVAPKERLSEDVAATTIPELTTEDGTFYPKIDIPGGRKGMSIPDFRAIREGPLKLAGLREADLARRAALASQEKRTREQISSRERIAQWRNITSLAVAEKNNITRRASSLLQSEDKEILTGAKVVLDAQKKLADLKGKVSTIKDFFGLEGPRQDAINEAAQGLDNARNNLERLVSIKQKGGGEGFTVPAGAPPAPREDGKVLRDVQSKQIIAKSQGGKWVAP